MADIVALGNAAGRCCGVLAASIARHVTLHDKDAGCGKAGAMFYHLGDSTLEAATVALVALGVLVPVPHADRPEERWLCNHRLTMDADAMPDFLARTLEPGDGRIERTVAVFVSIACVYYGLSDRRDVFDVPDAYRREMDALIRLGYATAEGFRVRWTDKVAPAMCEAYLWDGNFQSRAAAEEEERQAEAEAAWRTMPEPIRDRFFRRQPEPFMEFVKLLCRCWDGETRTWHSPHDGPIVLSGEKRLAETIIGIAQDRH